MRHKLLKSQQLPHLLMLVVLILAAWLRLWQLKVLPPGLWYDEAYNMMDALWVYENRAPQLFFTGNNGREPMLHYLGGLFMMIWGSKPYVFRLVSAFAGIFSVSLIYRWLVDLFAPWADRRWLALFAAAGLSFSFWHLMMSRIGLRAILFPTLVLVTVILFWRGLTRRSWIYFVAAGVALGLSQYTYLPARVLPLLFVLFALIWLLLSLLRPTSQVGKPTQSEVETTTLRPTTARFWTRLFVMALFFGLVFLPLGIFFLNNLDAFWSRTDDVSVLSRVKTGDIQLIEHVFQSLRLFVDGYHATWRLDVVGRPSFDWLMLTGFWAGIVVTLIKFRQPHYLFLLLGLFLLLLPALLSSNPIHSLRMSGMLVFFCAIMALGLITVTGLIRRYFSGLSPWINPLCLSLLILVSGGRTTYDYFVRWASEPEVYWRYDGPLIDLISTLVTESKTDDLFLPLSIYLHPTTRILLHNEFQEIDKLPVVNLDRPAILVTVPDIERLSEARIFFDQREFEQAVPYVWLSHYGSKNGVAYISQPVDLNRLKLTDTSTPLLASHTDETIAFLTPLRNVGPMLPFFTGLESFYGVAYDFGQLIRLVGYEVSPGWVNSDQSPVLKLAWQSLTGQPLASIPFIQIISGQGEPLGQFEGDIIPEKMLRWRQDGITYTQYPLWLGADTLPGNYLVRMGLFDPETGERLPVFDSSGQPLGDQVILGLFYVTDGDTDPRQPGRSVPAWLGDRIKLLGFTLLPNEAPSNLSVQLYWQAEERVDVGYTAFVQLLDERNEFIAGWDAQPLAGLYPTSRWQPDEIVIDRFTLSLPPDLSPGDYRLVTGMYDLNTGLRLPAFDKDMQLLPDDMVILTSLTLP